MADLIENIYPFDFSVLQLQSCQNATFNMMRFITRFAHVGRLFPPKRSHCVDILPYLFPVVKATSLIHWSTQDITSTSPTHGLESVRFLWRNLYIMDFFGCTSMHVEFQRFFPTKKTPTQKLQEPGSWARVSKSLEAGLSCHVGWTKDVSLGKTTLACIQCGLYWDSKWTLDSLHKRIQLVRFF